MSATELRKCRDCAAWFTLAENEIRFYAQRDLRLPARCEACRRARRLAALDDRPEGTQGKGSKV